MHQCLLSRSADCYIIWSGLFQRSAVWQAVSGCHGDNWVIICFSSSSRLAQAYSHGSTGVLRATRGQIVICKYFLSFCLYHIVCCPLAKSSNMVNPVTMGRGYPRKIKRSMNNGALLQSYITAGKSWNYFETFYLE